MIPGLRSLRSLTPGYILSPLRGSLTSHPYVDYCATTQKKAKEL